MFDYLSKFYYGEALTLFEEDPLLELPKDLRATLEEAADQLPPDFLPKLRSALRGLECGAFRTGAQLGSQLMLELMGITA